MAHNVQQIEAIVRPLVEKHLLHCHKPHYRGTSDAPLGNEAFKLFIYFMLFGVAAVFTIGSLEQHSKTPKANSGMRSIGTQTDSSDTLQDEMEWTPVLVKPAAEPPKPPPHRPMRLQLVGGVVGQLVQIFFTVRMTVNGVVVGQKGGFPFYPIVILFVVFADVAMGCSIHMLTEVYSKVQAGFDLSGKRTNLHRFFELVFFAAMLAMAWPWYALWVGYWAVLT